MSPKQPLHCSYAGLNSTNPAHGSSNTGLWEGKHHMVQQRLAQDPMVCSVPKHQSTATIQSVAATAVECCTPQESVNGGQLQELHVEGAHTVIPMMHLLFRCKLAFLLLQISHLAVRCHVLRCTVLLSVITGLAASHFSAPSFFASCSFDGSMSMAVTCSN
jgi:hypothetical protein